MGDQQVDLDYFLDRLLEMHNAQLQELMNYRKQVEDTQTQLFSLRGHASSPNDDASTTSLPSQP